MAAWKRADEGQKEMEMKERELTNTKRFFLTLWDIICGLSVVKTRFISSLCLAILIGLFALPDCLSALGDSYGFIFVRLGIRIAGSFGWRIADSIILNIFAGIFHIVLWVCLPLAGVAIDFFFVTLPGIVGAFAGIALASILNFLIFVLKDVFKVGISGYASFSSFAGIGASVSFALIHTFLLLCLFYYFLVPFLWKFVIVPIAGVFISKRAAE